MLLFIQKYTVNSEGSWDYPGLSYAWKIHYNQPVLELKNLEEKIEY